MTHDHASFWRLLDDGARAVLGEHGRVVVTPAGEVLVAQHEESGTVTVLLRGAVRISAQAAGGREMLLGVRGEGDLVGELAALDQLPRTASIQAFADVHGLTIRGAVFRRLVAEHPVVSRAVILTLAARLRDADAKRLEHVAGDGTSRVASRLVELADRFGEDRGGAIVVPLPVTQAELAGWAGTSLETTVRALASLRRAGWITTGRGSVTILDLDSLLRRAGRTRPA